MGRFDFRPQQVYAQTSLLIQAGRLGRRPAWFEPVATNPPPQILTRTRPLEHTETQRRRNKTKKASKRLFHPKKIEYPEDEMRSRFFQDHPWELARPRLVLEDDGVNGMETWDHIRQKGRPLNGESVVQRQIFLMDNNNMTKQQAYDQARSELYAERLREDVERRVAKEEATYLGATFGKDRITIGMELEDRAYEGWREWADKEVTAREQLRVAATVTQDATSIDPDVNHTTSGEPETAEPASQGTSV